MTHTVSQVERLVKAARSFKGISRIDFQLPDVIDGGDPILNFPGRMWDAEKAGFSFEVIGKRNKCKVFRLIEVERSVSDGETSAERQTVPCSRAGADVPLSLDEPQTSLFAGVERGKGQHGFHDQEAA